jgi:hypothetical protein
MRYMRGSNDVMDKIEELMDEVQNINELQPTSFIVRQVLMAKIDALMWVLFDDEKDLI